MLFGILGALASLLWIWLAVSIALYRAELPILAELPADEPPGGWPSLSVIFAARNEAGGVEQAVQSLVAQDYPALEVIAVDDRSTDRTGEILDAVARVSPALRVVHVQSLPPGWLGKNHALHAAAGSSQAQWLFFTDADVVFAPGALRKALAYAVAKQAGHLVVVPQIPTRGMGERLFMAMFTSLFSFYAPPWKVEDMRSRAHVGIGAFNLVRAEAYRAIGGFERLALSVDDDMRLGQALKTSGAQPRIVSGLGAVSVRWQVGCWGMIRGMEKNFFGGADYSLFKALGFALMFLWVGMGPHVGLLAGLLLPRSPVAMCWSAVCAAGLAGMCWCCGRVGRESGISWHHGLTMPVSALLLVFSLARSVWLTLSRGGVRWRDHHYPLDLLRAHVRERQNWLRTLRKAGKLTGRP